MKVLLNRIVKIAMLVVVSLVLLSDAHAQGIAVEKDCWITVKIPCKNSVTQTKCADTTCTAVRVRDHFNPNNFRWVWSCVGLTSQKTPKTIGRDTLVDAGSLYGWDNKQESKIKCSVEQDCFCPLGDADPNTILLPKCYASGDPRDADELDNKKAIGNTCPEDETETGSQ